MQSTRRWGLKLQGHDFDLADWREALAPAYDPVVLLNEEDHILCWSGFDGLETASEVLEAGGALLDQLNGAMSVINRSRSVRSNVVVQFQEDGTLRQSVVMAVGSAEVRIRGGAVGFAIVAADGTRKSVPDPAASKAQTWIGLVDQHEELGDALVYLGRSEWFDIYKAIECLEDWLGGEGELRKRAWVDDAELKNTKRMANSVRHRRNGKHKPPAITVSLQDAQQLLRIMIERAFDEAALKSH